LETISKTIEDAAVLGFRLHRDDTLGSLMPAASVIYQCYKSPMIHVCSLFRLHETVEQTGARHVVTLLKDVDLVQRPRGVSAENHLILGMDDITGPLEGYVAPADEHVAKLIEFVRSWNRAAPVVMHCYAGISRSTAAAYVAACTLSPAREELAIALALRRVSPTATPNLRLVALADAALGRDGRMSAAIEQIGRGVTAFEGDPFRLDIA
jgi:predicted protein tyrosine phosphatase